MSVCRTERLLETTDECGNPIADSPSPLSSNDQIRNQSPLNRAFIDKFLMVFDVPQCIKEQTQKSFRECNQVSLDTMQFNIFGTIVPNIALPTISVPYGGHTPKVAGHSRTTDPMNVNYFIDNTFANYWILWAWADFIIGSTNSIAGAHIGDTIQDVRQRYDNVTLRDYSTNISIFGLGAYNKPVVEWVYKGCVLSSLGGIQYNYQGTGDIISTFTFDYSFLDCRLR